MSTPLPRSGDRVRRISNLSGKGFVPVGTLGIVVESDDCPSTRFGETLVLWDGDTFPRRALVRRIELVQPYVPQIDDVVMWEGNATITGAVDEIRKLPDGTYVVSFIAANGSKAPQRFVYPAEKVRRVEPEPAFDVEAYYTNDDLRALGAPVPPVSPEFNRGDVVRGRRSGRRYVIVGDRRVGPSGWAQYEVRRLWSSNDRPVLRDAAVLELA